MPYFAELNAVNGELLVVGESILQVLVEALLSLCCINMALDVWRAAWRGMGSSLQRNFPTM